MNELLQLVASGAVRLLNDPRNLLDILVIAVVTFWVLSILQGTTAMAVVRGIVIVYLVGGLLTTLFGLSTSGWVLRNLANVLMLFLIVVFAPELRRALEQVGRPGGVLTRPVTATATGRTIDVLANAARRLADLRWGALIVVERETGLGEYAATGTRLDAVLSDELLLNVFYPHAPLHDGAAIVRGERIVAAGCLLPLTDATRGTGHLGTRHRAAMGITERTDAVCVVVSEESGQISIANNGRMVRNLDEEKLRKVLQVIYRPALERPAIAGVRTTARNLVERAFGRREAQPRA